MKLGAQILEIRNLYSVFCLGLVILCAGCATTEYKALPEVPKIIPKTEKKEGIEHKVKKGQTLWSISKSYNISVEEIILANKIPNAAAIEVGQLLFIPGATEVKEPQIPITPDENKDEFAWPIKGKIISYFKERRGEGVNRGIDIAANPGDLVKAVRQGKVILADYMSGYYHTVMIDHKDGFISVYANNRKLLVKTGDEVLKGDPIAEVGSLADKSFLHFEIRKGKEATNPLFYLP